ncbi:hypothetical protein Slala03_73680 [Streptomyces lavendulae subsp. lavendulae]|uniref:hypothetical protein n=1 Tax=Streptomyces lavendulae TaxID=1914 RepID=UPI0024A382F9|nr:hypothetical protein [Streptomyces lavendulae]GLV87679.1 hypothetical protein Slala03_73680 [Streptomyces lavendulae subsp. lavendulae]
MINKTVRGMAVLAAAGVVWMGAASTNASASTTAGTTAGTTVSTVADTAAASAADTSALRPGRAGEDDDRGHVCVYTTAWGTGDCHQRLH